jgi:hypothetical protein
MTHVRRLQTVHYKLVFNFFIDLPNILGSVYSRINLVTHFSIHSVILSKAITNDIDSFNVVLFSVQDAIVDVIINLDTAFTRGPSALPLDIPVSTS